MSVAKLRLLPSASTHAPNLSTAGPWHFPECAISAYYWHELRGVSCRRAAAGESPGLKGAWDASGRFALWPAHPAEPRAGACDGHDSQPAAAWPGGERTRECTRLHHLRRSRFAARARLLRRGAGPAARGGVVAGDPPELRHEPRCGHVAGDGWLALWADGAAPAHARRLRRVQHLHRAGDGA